MFSEREGLRPANFNLGKEIEPESCRWLFKSPLAGRGHVMAARLRDTQLV